MNSRTGKSNPTFAASAIAGRIMAKVVTLRQAKY